MRWRPGPRLSGGGRGRCCPSGRCDGAAPGYRFVGRTDRAVSQPPGGGSAWPLARRRRLVVPRRLVASGSGLLALHCLVGIQRPLELTPLYLRNDLDEYGHDGASPQCPTERIQQVGHQCKRLRRWRRSEQVATDLGGQANHEADRQALVQEPLPVGPNAARISGRCSSHRRGARIARSCGSSSSSGDCVERRSIPVLRPWPNSCHPVQLRASVAPGRLHAVHTPDRRALRRWTSIGAWGRAESARTRVCPRPNREPR